MDLPGEAVYLRKSAEKMLISYKLKFQGGTQYLYAIGERNAVIEATQKTFTNHGLKIHRSKDQEFRHYPGGWFDRANSAHMRASGGYGHETDHYSISYHSTNHMLVTRLCVKLLRKQSIFNKKKIALAFEMFYAGLFEEFGRLSIPLVANEDWRRFVFENPEFDCSPRWKDHLDQ